MTVRELRNTVVRLLYEALSVPIVLSDEVQPEEEYPYIIYTMTTPHSSGPFGDHSKRVEETPDGPQVIDQRKGHAEAVFSFTACSVNREAAGGWISGEDEAEDLTDRAVGWFLHGGYTPLMLAGIVVRDVMDVGSRSILEIDEIPRQYGFDVRLGYARVDEAAQGAVDHVVTIQKKE